MRPPSKLARPIARLLEQLQHTGDGVFAVDAQQRIIFWNEAASSLLRYAPGEVIGRYCYDIIQAKDCDGKMVCQKHCSHIEQAKKFRWLSHQCFQTRSNNGEAVWIDVTTLSILSPQRELSALVHIFRQTDPITVTPPTEPLAERKNVSAFLNPLSHREMEVLFLITEGRTTREISTQLFISPITIRNHTQNILKKLRVHTRLEAILWAIRNRLVITFLGALFQLIQLAWPVCETPYV
ncbi:MAG: PAS domain-containing protein [Acidobacteria bacterium]|nr:PAS domain-containing protein [Acidobacteriota bacterium]